MSIKELWAKVPDSWKAEGKSVIHTFLAAVGIELLLRLKGADMSFNQSFLLALGSAALRSGLKSVLEMLYAQFGQKGGQP